MSLGTEVEVPGYIGTPNVAPFIQEGRREYPGLFQDRESNICSREIIGKHSRDNINLHLGWGGDYSRIVILENQCWNLCLFCNIYITDLDENVVGLISTFSTEVKQNRWS